jgi:hypothetical protein
MAKVYPMLPIWGQSDLAERILQGIIYQYYNNMTVVLWKDNHKKICYSLRFLGVFQSSNLVKVKIALIHKFFGISLEWPS